MQIEYIASVNDGVVRYYRSDDGYEGFHNMPIAQFQRYLQQERNHLNTLEDELIQCLAYEDDTISKEETQ